MMPVKASWAAFPLAAALLVSCVFEPEDKTYRSTTRHFFKDIDAGSMLYFETRFVKTCLDGVCEETREKDHQTQAFRLDKASGKSTLLASRDADRLPGFFIPPYLFVDTAGADAVVRIDCRDGSKSVVSSPFRFLNTDSSRVFRHFLSEDGKYLVTRECSGNVCRNVLYDYPAGTVFKSLALSEYANYLAGDSLILFGQSAISDLSMTSFRVDVSSGKIDSMALIGSFRSTITTHTGQLVVLYQADGKVKSFPALPHAKLNSHLEDIAGLEKSGSFLLFVLNLESGDYVHDSAGEVYQGNIYEGKRKFLFKAHELVRL